MANLSGAAALCVGSTQATAAYLGSTLVWAPAAAGSFTVTWDFTGDSMAGTSSSVAVGASPVTGTGLPTFASASWPGYATVPVLTVVPPAGAATPTDSATLTGYIQLAAGPVGQWAPTSLAFDGGKGASSGIRGALIRTSADGYAADVTHVDFTTVRPTFAPFTVDLSAVGPVTGQLGIRVYPYSSTASGGLEFDNFVLSGTA